jgi:hypothetical protein
MKRPQRTRVKEHEASRGHGRSDRAPLTAAGECL